MGGTYVNDFNRFGRLYRVYVQSEADYRRKPEDIGDVYVREPDDQHHDPALDAASPSPRSGDGAHHALQPAALGRDPGCARARRQLRAGPGRARGGVPADDAQGDGLRLLVLSYQEKIAPPAAPTFILAIVFVFLLLAAMYESWRLPWAVLLGSPLVALGAFFGVWLTGYDNNVYVQIGLIMLVGLAAKNAILIVEFAKAKHEAGPVGRGRRARVRPAALPADPDDGLRLHPRRRAADAGERRGRGRPERHGHGGVLGDARRHRPRACS